MNLTKHCRPVIERFRSRLSLWKSKTLSLGGRLTLSKAVLGSLPTFYFSLFVAPASVIKTLEKLRRNFLWGGAEESRKINWVKWQKVLSPKNADVGSDEDTVFWQDRWNGAATLKDSFPELYKLERHKKCKVSDQITTDGLVWNWKSSPTSPDERSQLEAIIARAEVHHPLSRRDKWICNLSHDGTFQVRSLRSQIDERNESSDEAVIDWIHDIPIKVSCFMWRAVLDRLPTATTLIRRGIQLPSPTCTWCGLEPEDTDHVILRCPKAMMVWEWIIRWCEIPDLHFTHTKDLVEFTSKWGTCHKKRRTLIAICYGTAWLLWKARCDWIFKKTRSSPAVVADMIKSTVFTWVKHRRTKCTFRWMNWCVNPFKCV
ncbi:uncharacterized protein LOC128127534 [Lactuca sativa]|uniref:uncharacterized protein LOC128127534 n=1 Tax=Lactuca sativa TaxID=4236 RepID=UPI0022B028F4|nr:uncharacterized protein LOC128127534 [Lactuca sativa]